MPYTTLNLGLTLTIPTNGSRNWGTTLKNTTWTKISSHDHSGGGNGVQIVGSNALTDYSVTSIKLSKNIGFYQSAVILTPAGTLQTANWNDGVIQKLNLGSASGDVTLTLTNPVQGAYYRLFVIQGATPRDITWPAAVKWPQGQKPILSGATKIDMVWLYYDGTNYFGDWELDYL